MSVLQGALTWILQGWCLNLNYRPDWSAVFSHNLKIYGRDGIASYRNMGGNSCLRNAPWNAPESPLKSMSNHPTVTFICQIFWSYHIQVCHIVSQKGWLDLKLEAWLNREDCIYRLKWWTNWGSNMLCDVVWRCHLLSPQPQAPGVSMASATTPDLDFIYWRPGSKLKNGRYKVLWSWAQACTPWHGLFLTQRRCLSKRLRFPRPSRTPSPFFNA